MYEILYIIREQIMTALASRNITAAEAQVCLDMIDLATLDIGGE